MTPGSYASHCWWHASLILEWSSYTHHSHLDIAPYFFENFSALDHFATYCALRILSTKPSHEMQHSSSWNSSSHNASVSFHWWSVHITSPSRYVHLIFCALHKTLIINLASLVFPLRGNFLKKSVWKISIKSSILENEYVPNLNNGSSIN